MNGEVKQLRIGRDGEAWTLEVKRRAGGANKRIAEGTVYWGAFKWYATLEQAVFGLVNALQAEKMAKTELDTSALLRAVRTANTEVLAYLRENNLTEEASK